MKKGELIKMKDGEFDRLPKLGAFNGKNIFEYFHIPKDTIFKLVYDDYDEPRDLDYPVDVDFRTKGLIYIKALLGSSHQSLLMNDEFEMEKNKFISLSEIRDNKLKSIGI